MEDTRNYAAIPHEYLEEMDALTDAEFGRLVRSLLLYSRDGTPIAPSGNERFYANRVMAREDRYQEAYYSLSAVRSDAGKAGAEKRWQNYGKNSKAILPDGKTDLPMANDGSAYLPMASDSKNGYTEANTKANTNTEAKKNTTTRSARSSARAHAYEQAVDEAFGGREVLKQGVLRWLAYKTERRDSYGDTGLQTLFTRILKNADEFGDGSTVEQINNCISNNWKGLYFDKAQKQSFTLGGEKYGVIDLDALRELEKNI